MVINNVSYYYCVKSYICILGTQYLMVLCRLNYNEGSMPCRRKPHLDTCGYTVFERDWKGIVLATGYSLYCYIVQLPYYYWPVIHLVLFDTLFQWLQAWIMHSMTLSAGGCSCLWPQFCLAGGQLKKWKFRGDCLFLRAARPYEGLMENMTGSQRLRAGWI